MSGPSDDTPCTLCRRPMIAAFSGVCAWCRAGDCRFNEEHGNYRTAGMLRQHYQTLHQITPVVEKRSGDGGGGMQEA